MAWGRAWQVCFVAVLMPVSRLSAEQATNAVLSTPLSSIAAARSSVREPEYGRISTNSPAFEEYGFNLMLSQVNQMAERWKLELPHPLRVNEVVFWLKPKATSMQWILATRNARYCWDFDDGWVRSFIDEPNSRRAYLINTNAPGFASSEVLGRVAKTKSKITEAEAIRMARDCLHALGLTETQLRLHEPPTVERDHFTDEDGTRYEVPLFAVGWSVEGADPETRLVEITVSGITSNIVEYLNADPNTPRIALPTNYFQMLGLPTNYLETLSPRARRQLGLPPLH